MLFFVGHDYHRLRERRKRRRRSAGPQNVHRVVSGRKGILHHCACAWLSRLAKQSCFEAVKSSSDVLSRVHCTQIWSWLVYASLLCDFRFDRHPKGRRKRSDVSMKSPSYQDCYCSFIHKVTVNWYFGGWFLCPRQIVTTSQKILFFRDNGEVSLAQSTRSLPVCEHAW